MRARIKLINLSSLALLWALVILPAGARADISQFYVISSCDPVEGVARISSVNVFEGETPPKEGLLLSSLPPYNSNDAALLICNLGPRREITIKGVVDDDHPRNDGIRLYVNLKPMQYPISITSNVMIYYDKEDFYVSIKQCGNYQLHCFTERITSPSFQCNSSNSKIEKMICRSDVLSADDLELNHIYKRAIDHVRKRNALINDENQWIKNRQKICNVPEWSPSNSEYDIALICVKKLYNDRIKMLNTIYNSRK